MQEDFTIAFIGLTSVFSRDGISVGNPLDNLKLTLEELKNKSDINKAIDLFRSGKAGRIILKISKVK